MNRRTIGVVGAGAAGLTAAIRAAESGARVTLLNAHPKIGLKILMSGGTRCNVTHREVTAADFHGGSRHVIARILRAFTPAETRAWFESMGVALKLEDTGKYFPVTDDAGTRPYVGGPSAVRLRNERCIPCRAFNSQNSVSISHR